MSIGTFVRWCAAFAFSLFIAWTGYVISDLLRVPTWLGTALWLSFFVTLYLELVASLQERVGKLSKKIAERSAEATPAATAEEATGPKPEPEPEPAATSRE